MLRTTLLCLAALSALLVLQGCSNSSNQPFAKSNKPSGRPPPAISVTRMNGVPQDKSALMVSLLQESAAKRDIPITAQDFPDSWKLTGDFVPQREPGGTIKLVYGWTLWDAKGRSIHQISGAEPTAASGANPWSAVTTESLRRVAGFTTESLSSRLAQLGFATQVGGLMPPTDTYARAGPNAEQEIDYETLYGPQVAAASPGSPGLPRPDPQTVTVPDEQAAKVATAPAPAEPVEQPKKNAAGSKKPKTAKKEGAAIRGVAVTKVSGSPGNGNRELADAMRRTLKQAGWPVFSSPRPDALTITGDVELGPRRGQAQKVALAWKVLSPDGKVLGTIKQANDVPAGSLDQGWGKTADYAAQAGAEGIFKLVGKLR